MKAKLHIETGELEERITRRVITAMKPLLRERSEETTFFTVKGLAEHLQVSDKWIYERVQFKELPYYKLGGNLRFKRSAIDLWLETLKTPVVNALSAPLKLTK